MDPVPRRSRSFAGRFQVRLVLGSGNLGDDGHRRLVNTGHRDGRILLDRLSLGDFRSRGSGPHLAIGGNMKMEGLAVLILNLEGNRLLNPCGVVAHVSQRGLLCRLSGTSHGGCCSSVDGEVVGACLVDCDVCGAHLVPLLRAVRMDWSGHGGRRRV